MRSRPHDGHHCCTTVLCPRLLAEGETSQGRTGPPGGT
jgi:hypothetical protein